MIDDDNIIHDAEGARILGINNPMNGGGSGAPDDFAELLDHTQHTAAQVAAMLISMADVPAEERLQPLLAAQDGAIHLLIEVHGLLHMLAR